MRIQNRLNTTGLLAAFLGVIAVLTTTSPRQAAAKPALVCKPALSAVGRASAIRLGYHRARRVAKTRAVIKWRRRARHLYGFRYQSWRLAKRKRMHCAGTAAGFLYCTVRAHPCKLIFPLKMRLKTH